MRSTDAERTAAWYQARLDLTADPAIRPEGTNLTIIILRGSLAVVEVLAIRMRSRATTRPRA